VSKPTSAAAVRDRLSGALTTGTGRQADQPLAEEPVPAARVLAAAPATVERSTGARQVTRPGRPERLVRVTIDLDPDVHQAVKVRLAEGSVTLAGVVRELLRRYDDDADVRHEVLTTLYAQAS
jgi:Flp pilus assembly protein CpaB